MKNKFLKVASIFFFAITALLVVSCDNDDLVPEFTFQPTSEDVMFQFTPGEEYLISSGTMSNVAERFVWNAPDFGVQTQISYQLQGSIDETFESYDSTIEFDSGTLSVTNAEVKVSDLNNLASLLGTEAGETSQVYFRVRAYAGSGEGNDVIETFSNVATLNISIIVETSGSGIELSSWGIVGSGYNDWGVAGPDAPFYTTSSAGVIVSYVNLLDGQIKFRENNSWGGDLGDANLDGKLDADADNNIDVTAGDYKITIDTNDNSYTIEPFSWGIVGSGFNNWGGGGLDAKFYYDYTTDTFKTSVKLYDGHIKFRPLNTWSGDFGDANLDGVLDTDSDNNIPVSEGHYLVTLNLNDNTYTIEEASVWGVVGSGYNNWGGDEWDHDGNADTPNVKVSDAALTEIQPGVWFAENITLLNGEIKFRPNNTWDGDLGDADLNNILDSDSDNNIAVEAGNYVITIDFNDPDGPRYLLAKRS